MARSKKTLVPKHQTHGALPDSENAASKSIYHILNKHRASPYNTDSIEEYTGNLKKMTLVQLQDHAMELGTVIPTDDRNKMIDKLIKEFAAYQSKVAQIVNNNAGINQVKTDKQKSTEDILAKYRFGV